MVQNALLLIEDNPILNSMYKAAFEKKGFSVFFAHHGEKGLEIAKEKKPDLIVLDLLMPGMNGFEVLAALKADPATKDIKVIVLTVVNKPESKEKAKALGAVDYLIKSDLDLSEIVELVTSHLSKK